MKNLKSLILSLFLGIGTLSAGDYTNNVRSQDDRDYSSFRIKKSDRSVQRLSLLTVPMHTGFVCSTALSLLAPGSVNETANPVLVQVASLTGDLKLHIFDGVLAQVGYQVVLPDGYISGGDLLILASSPSNVSTTTKMLVRVLQNDTASTTLSNTVVDGDSFEELEVDYSSVSLSPTDKVTILISRDDANSGTGSLEVRSIGIRYNKNIPFAE